MLKKILRIILLIVGIAAIAFFSFAPGIIDKSMNEQIIEIGKRNGLIGIGMWDTAVCGTDIDATACAIQYVANKIGVDKVAMGSDFDGATITSYDINGFPLVVNALLKKGFSRQDIEKIMGGNVRDFMLRNLPD